MKVFSQNTIPQTLNVKDKIGSIQYDSSRDSINFHLCDEYNISEYYQVSSTYVDGLYGIRKDIQKHIEVIEDSFLIGNGILVIRFILNCRGELGRFRVKKFDSRMKLQIVSENFRRKIFNIFKNMNRWLPGEYDKKKYDVYVQFKLRFKGNKCVDIMY